MKAYLWTEFARLTGLCSSLIDKPTQERRNLVEGRLNGIL